MESRTAFMGHVSRFSVTVFWLVILASVGILIGATTIVPGPPINKPRFISATNVDTFTSSSFQVGTGAVYVPLTVDSGGSLRIDPPAGVRNSGWITVNGPTTNIGVTYANGGIVSGQNVSSGPSDITIIDPSTGKYFTYEVLNANSNIVMREPTNGNMGLNYGVMVWTNVNGVTNQRMNFTFGSGITLDWTGRTISASAAGPTTSNNIPATVTWFGTAPATNVLVDLSLGTDFTFQATNQFALVFTNGSDRQTITVHVFQDATGNRTGVLKNNTGGSSTNQVKLGTTIPDFTCTTNALLADHARFEYFTGIAGIPNTTNRIDYLGMVRGY